jgi:hypothetical protein
MVPPAAASIRLGKPADHAAGSPVAIPVKILVMSSYLFE